MLSKVVAYKISPSFLRLKPEQYDLIVKEKERIQLHPKSSPPTFIHMNSMADIVGNDFPSNTQRLPTFSKVSLECLDLNDNYSIIPVHISGQEKQDWVVLHILQYTKVMDLDASEYDEDDLYVNNVGFVHKLVFKGNVDLPPIFSIEEEEGLFVTPETRLVWDMNSVSGIEYHPIFHI